MDINFLYIVSLVRSISIYDTGYAFLINNNGEIIYHPDIEKGEKLSDYVDIDIVKYINNIHNKRDNESNVHYEYNGKSKYLSIGKLNNNAYLVIAAPESEIFADAIVLRQRITLFAEMTAIVVFVEKRINEFMKLIYSGNQYYSYKMTCSSGIIFSSNCDTDSDKLILEADAAMYEAKKLGRGRYILRENN